MGDDALGNAAIIVDSMDSQRRKEEAASVLIRDIPSDVRAWIRTECDRRGVSQQELLRSVLQDVSVGSRQLALFQEPTRAAPAFMGGLPFTFIDLFAGIGGLRLGVEEAGGKCVFSSEWDAGCQKTYKAWFGEEPEGDITKISPSEIPAHDLLVAGFPCQPFSIAGVSKKKSLGRAHGFKDATQGNLFFNLATIIEIKRPPAFLLENVKNLKSHDKGRTWNVIKSTLDSLDYEVFTQVIDAASWVPQHRERVFIVGFDRKLFRDRPPFEFPKLPSGDAPVFRSILEQAPDSKYTLSDHLWGYLQQYAERHREKGNGFGFGLVNLDGVSRTLSARYYKDGSEVLIPQKRKNPRRLTPREAARLMGFPDELPIVVSDTQAYKQFGNAVVPKVASAVAKQIVQVLAKHLLEVRGGCLVNPRVSARKDKAKDAFAGV